MLVGLLEVKADGGVNRGAVGPLLACREDVGDRRGSASGRGRDLEDGVAGEQGCRFRSSAVVDQAVITGDELLALRPGI